MYIGSLGNFSEGHSHRVTATSHRTSLNQESQFL